MTRSRSCEPVSEIGCSALDEFAEQGVWVQLESTTDARFAWLLPDDLAFDRTGAAGMPRGYEWTLIAPNLAIGEAG
jgi:hypothetical protein